MHVCCRVRPPSSLTPKNSLQICANPMTRHGRCRVGKGGHVPTRGYATGNVMKTRKDDNVMLTQSLQGKRITLVVTFKNFTHTVSAIFWKIFV